MTHPTGFSTRFIACSRHRRRALPVLLLLVTGCAGEVTDPAAARDPKQLTIVNNTFTWASIDYTLRSASWVESAESSYVQLDLDATNRIPYGTTSLLDWDLALEDGSALSQADNGWFNLAPGQTQAFSIRFPAAQLPSLRGAELAPHQSNLNYAPARIQLDLAVDDAPVVLHQLIGKGLSTPEAFDTRGSSVTIKSAQLSPNSDVDGGERALHGHQFVDVVFDVHAHATNAKEAYFGADLASVEVDGTPVYEVFDSLLLDPGETGEVHFAFEIPDETTQFVLKLGTDGDSPASLVVSLDERLR
jgi:hypothetical protein